MEHVEEMLKSSKNVIYHSSTCHLATSFSSLQAACFSGIKLVVNNEWLDSLETKYVWFFFAGIFKMSRLKACSVNSKTPVDLGFVQKVIKIGLILLRALKVYKIKEWGGKVVAFFSNKSSPDSGQSNFTTQKCYEGVWFGLKLNENRTKVGNMCTWESEE